jgi:hypothetical protein
MYQRQSESNQKAASLEGMESVFETTRLPLESDNALPFTLAGAGLEAPAYPVVGTRKILRGSYCKGLLVLADADDAKNEPLTTQSSDWHAPQIPQTRDERGNEMAIAYASEVNRANSDLLELVKIHACQAKAANQLIIRLSERLKKSDQYIQVLLGTEKCQNLSAWRRLIVWLCRWARR